MSVLKNKVLLYLEQEYVTPLEKEVLSLILLASVGYPVLQVFLIQLYKKGLRSGIIPEFTSVTTVLSFCDRHYMEIEEHLSQWEKRSGETLVFEKDILLKVQLAHWAVFDILATVLPVILTHSGEIVNQGREWQTFNDSEFYAVLDTFLPSDSFCKVYHNLHISPGIQYICEQYPSFWNIVDHVANIQIKPALQNVFFQIITLQCNQETNTTLFLVNKDIYQDTLTYTFPFEELVLYYDEDRFFLSSEY